MFLTQWEKELEISLIVVLCIFVFHLDTTLPGYSFLGNHLINLSIQLVWPITYPLLLLHNMMSSDSIHFPAKDGISFHFTDE